MTPTLTVSLSPANVFNISKNLIIPLHCEWDQCDIILNSWNHLLKHQYKHCRKSQKTQDGIYRCYQLKCSGRDHFSISELMEHVQLSHMSRVPVPCLCKGCTKTFGRSDQILDHLKNTHSYLLNVTISTTSPLLARFASPSISSSAPPPLPTSPLPQCLVTSPVVNRQKIQHDYQTQTKHLQPYKRWSHLDYQDAEDKEPTLFNFDDLPMVTNRCPQVQVQDYQAAYHFSAPQSIEAKPPHLLPSLFSFQALAHHIVTQGPHH